MRAPREFINNNPNFIGLGNYRALVHDGVFISSLGHTLLLVCVTIPAELCFGLLIALLLNRSGWLYTDAARPPATPMASTCNRNEQYLALDA